MTAELLSSRKQSWVSKLALLGVLTFFLTAAVYTSSLIVRRQAALQEVSRYNTTWLVSQAALEVARLDGVVGAAMVPGSGVDEDDVQLWLDIVANRVQLLEGGEVADFIATSPALGTIVQEFRAAVAAAEVLMNGPPTPDRLPRLLKLVSAQQPTLARLAAAANLHGGAQVSEDQRQLSNLHWTFAAILGAITFCGFGLVATLAWHNRLLTQAQKEAQQRNATLQLRDFELNTQNARFDAALNNMSQALCMMDAKQRLIVCNVRFLELFGITSDQASPGATTIVIFAAIAAVGRYGAEMVAAMVAKQQVQATTNISCSFIEEDQAGRAIAVSQEPMVGGGWVATFEDITERRRTEARISFMAHHDALTSLPNRVLFHIRLEEALARHSGFGESCAILCVDLDQFKQVNDTLGHPAGDILLQTVAGRLHRCVRDGDMIVRLGGDEFAILQTGAPQPQSAETLAKRVVDELGRVHDIDGHRVVVGASIGIAIAEHRAVLADTLLRNADIALYCAKADGRGTFRFFEDAMDTRIQAQRAIESDLREALPRGQFEVFYQPLFNLATDRICGFEALLRWRHPTLGMIPPGIFIPIAEELRLIVPIGEWVMAQAFAEAMTWPDNLKVAVNLSPVQFRSLGLVAGVKRALAVSGLPAFRVELEITESALLQDSGTVLAMLHELGALGLRIALDDFGTGYSSLSYLRSFPFSKLKIDRSFIREIAYRPDCEAIVRSVTGLAHTLGMTTTAEGVETHEQLDRLRDVGCTEVQGFLFDEPQPAGEITHWFNRQLLSPMPSAPSTVSDTTGHFSEDVLGRHNLHELFD